MTERRNTTEAQHLSGFRPPPSSRITNNDVANHIEGTHRTPPSINRNLSPYARIPLPLTTRVSISLNPILRYDPTPGIAYSIAYSPSSATPGKPHLAHPQWLHEPATLPNLAYLTIRATWQERAIVVFPGDPTVHGVVTIWDVLVAVHRALRDKAAGIHSYTHPNAQSPALFHDLRQRSVIRPDEGTVRASMMMLLQGRATWKGLSPSTIEVDVWHLHIG